jgi:hydroxymethylpyrimidine/phosphomethylpyrimidine kinase
MPTPTALTIAGSDSGGGAGIQADLKTFSALGVYGASVITALTAQNTVGVQAVKDIPPSFVEAQMASVLSDLQVCAIKIGMLSRTSTIRAVAKGLSAAPHIPVVLDPVMVAASGDMLLQDSAVSTLRHVLIPRALLVTPNLPEAAALTGESIAVSEDDMLAQGQQILAMGAKAVLIKGGHGSGPESVDLLVRQDGVVRLPTARIKTQNVHGTGCTLSSAIAAGLAKGLPLEDACREAKAYITEAIKASARLSIGKGHGPAHHFHRWWG